MAPWSHASPGGRFTSDWIALPIPASAPDPAVVQVDIAALHAGYVGLGSGGLWR